MSPIRLSRGLVVTIFLAAGGGCKKTELPVATVKSGGVATGELRGFANVGRQLKDRLFDKDDAAARELAIERTAGTGIAEVSFLLGAFSTAGERRVYVNGQPNPLSALLWHQILGQFARRIGAKCATIGTDNSLPMTVASREDATVAYKYPFPTIDGEGRDIRLEEEPTLVAALDRDSRRGGAPDLDGGRDRETAIALLEEPSGPGAPVGEGSGPGKSSTVAPPDAAGPPSEAPAAPETGPAPKLGAAFARILKDLCEGADKKEAKDDVLEKLWRRVLTAEASTNQAAWTSFASTVLKGDGEVAAKVQDVMLALLLDPEFLLER